MKIIGIKKLRLEYDGQMPEFKITRDVDDHGNFVTTVERLDDLSLGVQIDYVNVDADDEGLKVFAEEFIDEALAACEGLGVIPGGVQGSPQAYTSANLTWDDEDIIIA